MSLAVENAILDLRRLIRDAEVKLNELSALVGYRGTEPETDISLYFDGGVKPGHAYGSYRIGTEPIQRVRHGSDASSNQAEYLTLVRGLQSLRERITPADHSIVVYGDSQLVINQIIGDWACRHPKLVPLRDQAMSMLGEYRSWRMTWLPREQIVSIFGH